MGYGQQGHLGISFQDSFGTSNVASMDYFEFVSESLTETIEKLQSENLSSRYEEPDDYTGMQFIGGEVIVDVHPHTIGKFMKAWTGQESVSYQGSCYSHLFLPRTDDWDNEKSALQPLTIEVFKDTGSASLFSDMLLNTLTFDIAQGSLLKSTAGFIGANFAWANKTTPSYETGSLMTWDTSSVSLAASAVDDISQLTISLNNGLAGKAYLDGTRRYNRILRDTFRTIEISGNMLLNSDTEVRNYKNRTLQRLLVNFTDPTTVMNAHNQIIFDIPKMRYSEFPDNISGPGLIEIPFSAEGRYDSTSSYAFQITLVNTTAAYG